MVDKIAPHNIEAEESVIGSILIDGPAISQVADYLEVADFYNERTAYIYGACLALYKSEQAINQVTVAQQLAQQGQFETAGGAAYLSYMIATCPTSVDIDHYAAIVCRLSTMRKIIAVGERIQNIGYEARQGATEAIDEARLLIDSIKPAHTKVLELTNLRIIKSQPPHYILSVNGQDLRVTMSQLQTWGKFKSLVLSELDFIPAKPKNWEAVVNGLLARASKLEAPGDTSVDTEVKLAVKRWFDQRGEGSEYSDIQSGSYAIVKYRGKETDFAEAEYWAFQPTPLKRWLKRSIEKVIAQDALWAMMFSWGAIKHQWRIGKSKTIPLKLWALPPDFADKAEFAVEEKAEQPEMALDSDQQLMNELDEELPDI